MDKKSVGMVGLGKLGLPCLLAMEKHGGYQVKGFDTSLEVVEQITNRKVGFWEQGVNDYLRDSKIEIAQSAAELVETCDIIFIAVPTPHEFEFEGSTPVPNSRKDFDYSYLEAAARDIAQGLQKNKEKNPLLVVISTVLPGTMKNKILPILEQASPNLRFCYNPYFIAMGTTISDFLNPEFLLVGSLNPENGQDLEDFYQFLNSNVINMQIESAELTKVAYNTFIGFKIIFANALSEIVDKRGGNVDEVTNALSSATYRLMSGKYLSAGMGDGGGCHPRDQIAMSWLARECGISFDIFEMIASARDSQTKNQANLLSTLSRVHRLPVVVLGKAYKENSPLVVGSPAVLLTHFLEKEDVNFIAVDPFVDKTELRLREKAIYFIATRHEVFSSLALPKGSVLVDPWGFARVENPEGVIVLRPGRDNYRKP